MLPIVQFAVGATAALMLMRQRRIYRQALRLGSAMLETLLNAIDANDEETGHHVRRVAQYALEPLSAFYPDLPAGVLAHHERWDGTGYPRGSKGRHIPQSARIVAIVDAFDAITHRRPYSRARSLRDAREALLAGRGTQFDPDLVDLFLSPMVQECVADIRLAPGGRSKGNNRRCERVQSAPDLIFRWRPAKPARPSRRRRRRTAS